MNFSKSTAMYLLIANSLLFLIGCTQNSTSAKVKQDWHPAINKQLEELDHNNILSFGKLEKEDGRYCYVSYEGFMRDEQMLSHTLEMLQVISKQIESLLKTEFATSIQEISKKRKIKTMDELTASENSYLQKKSEMECLKVLAERQMLKYTKRISDRRVGLK